MAYIYMIINNINNKQYVGKTNLSIQKRFEEHIRDSKRERCEKRPLYNAMNKYGIENFSVQLLEECSSEESSNKEIYWINKLDTYKNGYNATLGGDGKNFYDYKELANAYLELGRVKAVHEKFNCDCETVRKACKEYNIRIVSPGEISKAKNGKSVSCFDKSMNFIKCFDDMSDAARWIIQNSNTTAQVKHISANIGRVISGKRKTAYGYKWEYC